MAKKKTTRRGNNEGTICQRKDGTYCSAVSLGNDENGKPIRKYFYGKSRSEVAIKMTSALTNNFKGVKTSIQNDDFQTIMKDWMFTFKKAAVTSRTFESCLVKAERYIFPQIGKLKLNEINTPIIQRLLNNLILKEYALDTVKRRNS